MAGLPEDALDVVAHEATLEGAGVGEHPKPVYYISVTEDFELRDVIGDSLRPRGNWRWVNRRKA